MEDIIEVLTPLGACVLFGRSTEAVRRAAREGKVRTELVIDFEARPVRLVELQSALQYWKRPNYSGNYERGLSSLREAAPVLEVSGQRYKILHPWALARVHPTHPDTPSIWFKEKVDK